MVRGKEAVGFHRRLRLTRVITSGAAREENSTLEPFFFFLYTFYLIKYRRRSSCYNVSSARQSFFFSFSFPLTSKT